MNRRWRSKSVCSSVQTESVVRNVGVNQWGSIKSGPSSVGDAASTPQIEPRTPFDSSSLRSPEVDSRPTRKSGVGRQPREHRRQIEVAVCQIRDDPTAWFQLFSIECERLAREQMHRHGVGTEGIENQEIERGIRLVRECALRVGDHHVKLARGRIAQEREQTSIPCHIDDGRVDLVEPPALPGPRVRGERADAQAGYADAGLFPVGPSVEDREDRADGAAPIEIGGRLSAPVGVKILLAVKRVAMKEVCARVA